MESVYTKVKDIDAFTGAISEIPVSGGLVGPTVACILGQQFQNLMIGDRYNLFFNSFIVCLVFLDFSSLIQMMEAIVRRVFTRENGSLFRPGNSPALFVTTFKMV